MAIGVIRWRTFMFGARIRSRPFKPLGAIFEQLFYLSKCAFFSFFLFYPINNMIIFHEGDSLASKL